MLLFDRNMIHWRDGHNNITKKKKIDENNVVGGAAETAINFVWELANVSAVRSQQ